MEEHEPRTRLERVLDGGAVTAAVCDSLTLVDATALRAVSRACRDAVTQHAWNEATTPVRNVLAWRQCFPHARTIRLVVRDRKEVVRCLHTLEKIALRAVTTLVVPHDTRLEQRQLDDFSALRVLDLRAATYTRLTPKTLASLSPHLRYLDLSCTRLPSLEAAGTTTCLAHLAHLDTLLLAGCTNVTDALVAPLHSLRTLVLDSCARITDAALAPLTRLQTLHVNDCPHVTAAGVEPLRQLTTLCCVVCPRIAASDARRWQEQRGMTVWHEGLWTPTVRNTALEAFCAYTASRLLQRMPFEFAVDAFDLVCAWTTPLHARASPADVGRAWTRLWMAFESAPSVSRLLTHAAVCAALDGATEHDIALVRAVARYALCTDDVHRLWEGAVALQQAYGWRAAELRTWSCATWAARGDLPGLQYAYEAQGCVDAAWTAPVHVADVPAWCPADANACAAAAAGGHLHVLQWARNNWCPWDARTCVLSTKARHWHVVAWAHANGCPCTCTRARARRDTRPPMDDGEASVVAATGSLVIVGGALQWWLANKPASSPWMTIGVSLLAQVGLYVGIFHALAWWHGATVRIRV